MASFIDAGLPQDRDAWPEGVLEALRGIAQGDVVPCPPVVYFGDPKRSGTFSQPWLWREVR